MFRRRRAVPESAPPAVAGPVAAPAHRHDPAPVDGVETPYVLRFSAAWAWRLLLVAAAVYVFLHVFSLLSVVLVPVIIGLLIAAALSPLADRLVRWNLPRSLATLVVVVGAMALIAALVAAQYAYFARTAFGAAKAERQKDYVEAALSTPLSGRRVLLRHLLPNTLPPLIVVATVQVATAISLEATLSFLGLGLPVTQPSLGLLIANGFQFMLSGRYWISVYPGIALMLTVLAINLVGDQLRQVLNPKRRR